VGSAPSFAHGVCDDIPTLGAIAIEKDIWFHVDACVGGCLLPFLRRIGEPEIRFDLTVDGVRSISADLHKFGYVPRCLSSFTLRDSTDREYHTFTFSNWPCGNYVTEVQAGTRVTSVVASAWVVMKYLGEEGYMELARQLREAARQYQTGIEAIPGLRLVGKAEAGILVYTSDTLDILKIEENLIAAIGTPLIVVPHIPGIHMLLQPIQHHRQVEHYLTTLSRVTDGVRRGEGRGAAKDHSYA
jgi:sphinganine-1-phosphate aldolase